MLRIAYNLYVNSCVFRMVLISTRRSCRVQLDGLVSLESKVEKECLELM